MDLGAPELLIILAVVLVLFGGKRLPGLARALGESLKEFRHGAENGDPVDGPGESS
jgi:sec-independent protein translocase protein TatA